MSSEDDRTGASPAAADNGCDVGAFEALYRLHQGAVHALARRVAGPAMADDVTQEVFARLWRQPDRYDPGRGSMRTFLLTIAHHVAVDVIRAETALRTRTNRYSERRDAHRGAEGADRRVLLADDRATIGRALKELPEAERAAIVAAYFEGHTYRRVARLLDVPEGTVKSRIRSGMRRLELSLAGAWDAHPLEAD